MGGTGATITPAKNRVAHLKQNVCFAERAFCFYGERLKSQPAGLSAFADKERNTSTFVDVLAGCEFIRSHSFTLKRVKVLQVSTEISASRGGIVAALAGMLPALERQGVHSELIALAPRAERPEDSPLWGPNLHLARPLDPFFGLSLDARPLMERLARQSSVIHSHGLWMFLHYLSYRVAREHELPHIISVHGMAQPYIQARSRWKKAPIDWWFQDRALARARVLHALVPTEVEDIRRLGLHSPIALIPNGTGLDDAPAPPREELNAAFPALRDKRVLLFMARLHPKKGLIHFLPAWHRAGRARADWHLLLAGPDEGGHRAELEAQVAALGLQDSVSFAGLLTGHAKRTALGNASAFVLPSHSEGFSMSLLEALGARVPVLLTPGCNFPEAVAAGGALEMSATEAGSLDGLTRLFALSDTERAAMGARGRALVERDYSWDTVAAKWQAVYAWCAGKGEKPECVVG